MRSSGPSVWRFGRAGLQKTRPTATSRRVFRHRGMIIPPGMLAISKAARRPEREVNRAARAAIARDLETELADILVSFREGITVGATEAAIVGGDARVIVNALVPNELEAQLAVAIGEHLEDALERGAEIGLRFAPPALQGVPVSLATQATIAALESQAGLAALGLAQATQAGIQEILLLGITDQLAPVEVARRVGQLAGLTPRDVRAVQNFRRTVTRNLAPIPDALTPQVQRVIAQQTGRYRDRLVLARGRTIAETEIQSAIQTGERAFYERAVADGAAQPEGLFKTWRTVDDLRVCPICAPLHGQIIGFDDLFSTSVGPKIGPPAHPRCRCFLEYGELDGSGTPPRSDRGPEAIEAQRAARRLDPDSLREDLVAANARRERTQQRLRRIDPSTKTAAVLEDSILRSEGTVRSIRRRLEDLGEIA